MSKPTPPVAQLVDPVRLLLHGRLLARNVIWNFAGMAAPMLVGVVAIPLLIGALGKERFGLLSIIWMGVGYFSLFDMGLGRALTKMVAQRIGDGRQEDVGELIWTAIYTVLVLGILGAALLGWVSVPLVTRVLNVSVDLQADAVAAFRILALGIPAVVMTAALVGLLEAQQRFSTIALVRVPLGVMTFLSPLMTAHVDTSLALATSALLSMRVIALLVYFIAAANVWPELRRPQLPGYEFLLSLIRYGGWLTVSNVIGPLMVYFDRFLIGVVVSMVAVTYYVTPYEVLSRLQVIPQAIVGVLFPAFSAVIISDKVRLESLYRGAERVQAFLMLPLVSVLFLFGPELLSYWVGEDFKVFSTPVVRWLAVGWMINAMAYMPFTVLQSSGRPDLIAKTHLIELGPYFLFLWVLTMKYGIAGAAAAWCLRVVADTVILSLMARKEIPELSSCIKNALMLMGVLVAGFSLAWTLDGLLVRLCLLLVVAGISAAVLVGMLKRLIGLGEAR